MKKLGFKYKPEVVEAVYRDFWDTVTDTLNSIDVEKALEDYEHVYTRIYVPGFGHIETRPYLLNRYLKNKKDVKNNKKHKEDDSDV